MLNHYCAFTAWTAECLWRLRACSGSGRLKNCVSSMLTAVSAKRVIFPFLLLLALLFIDHFFVRRIFSELDILEHFIFGFIISEATSRIAISAGIAEWIRKRQGKRNVRELGLSVRLVGFLVLGGLLWESLECFLLPAFGWQCNPFFASPITLDNIDGAIDVAVGILGCILAWYTAE
jgi:hypothetical protein